MTTTWAESLPTMTAEQLAEVGAMLDMRGLQLRQQIIFHVGQVAYQPRPDAILEALLKAAVEASKEQHEGFNSSARLFSSWADDIAAGGEVGGAALGWQGWVLGLRTCGCDLVGDSWHAPEGCSLGKFVRCAYLGENAGHPSDTEIALRCIRAELAKLEVGA